MPGLVSKITSAMGQFVPVEGFYFDRPLVLFQSDDWGRVGLRDQQGLEELQSAGLGLGERPYDFYTLETAEDVRALQDVLSRHRDFANANPCMEMNFLLFNLDFERMGADAFQKLHLTSLAAGLPRGWNRPGLFEAYREGIAKRVFQPALHGTLHFCRAAILRALHSDENAAELLRSLWRAGTPYIFWRMPWIGYEFWDGQQQEDARFLSSELQRELVGSAIGEFAKMFSTLPRSACAPGYRSNADTHKAWSQHGIQIAQNGPGDRLPPHFDHHGILHLSRTVEFEPATDPSFSIEGCMEQVAQSLQRGVPAVVSVHSINFHSTVRDFRTPTLRALEEFLNALETRHPNLLYLRDEELLELIRTGFCGSDRVPVKVTSKAFTKAQLRRGGR